MNRLSSALLLGGAVVLMSYINAPAAPTRTPTPASPDDVAAIDAMAPVALAAAQETARWRERLAVVPEKPAVQRDPFSFGTRSRVPRAKIVVPEPEAAAAEAAAPPALEWPTLVALLTDAGKMTAVLGLSDTVEMLATGETTRGFLVREITPTSIEVVHIATSVVTRLTLRQAPQYIIS